MVLPGKRRREGMDGMQAVGSYVSGPCRPERCAPYTSWATWPRAPRREHVLPSASRLTCCIFLFHTPQQLVKLAAASQIPGLSEHFLVFDSDMLSLRPLTWFIPAALPASLATGNVQRLMARLASQPSTTVPLPAAAAPPSAADGSSQGGCVNPFPFKVLIHVGGAR